MDPATAATQPYVESMTIHDFRAVVSDLESFWGNYRAESLHHPMFIYEFGNTAYCIKREGRTIAYCLSFFSQTAPISYVHALAVRRDFHGQGLGRSLYERVIRSASDANCEAIKAISTPENTASLAFHRKLGFELHGSSIENGAPLFRDYAGPGQHRVVMVRSLIQSPKPG